jgi:hypothetical protein
MLLFNRTVQTSGDFPAVMPILQEFSDIAKANNVPMNVWAGGNGFIAGTVVFSVAYESLAAGSESGQKLSAAKGWWEVMHKFREHVITLEADTILSYIRGGSLGSGIPVGTIVQSNQFQLAQGADWMGTLKWANEFAEMHTKMTGDDVNIAHTIYGVLGGVAMIMGYPNAEAIDASRAKISATAEWMTKFLEGGKFATAGTVMQRHMTKVA